jgi:hypothetical protein
MPLRALAPARRHLLPVVCLVLGTTALLPSDAGGQAATVTVLGFVTDTATIPVPAAEVVVEGTPLGTRTDEKGAFRLAGLRPGKLTITVRRLGFIGRSDRFETRAGDTLQVILDLVAVPTELAGVKVKGQRPARRSTWFDEFESRRSRGFGAFLTRADIEKRNPARTSDLFRMVTGMVVVPRGGRDEPRMARSLTCAPDIYIDGLEARGFRIDDMPPMEIGAIEVFRGPAETPVRFRRVFAAGCGVISIWTRAPGS